MDNGADRGNRSARLEGSHTNRRKDVGKDGISNWSGLGKITARKWKGTNVRVGRVTYAMVKRVLTGSGRVNTYLEWSDFGVAEISAQVCKRH
jgi:hypothetical protein